jgi:hypothetical protein
MSLSAEYLVKVEVPQSFSNSRVKFMVDTKNHQILASTLRVLNFGMFAGTTAFDNTTGAYYPITNGCMQSILSYTMSSGGDQIEYINNLPQYSTMQALSSAATYCQDVELNTIHNGWGWGTVHDQNVQGKALNSLGDVLTLGAIREDYFSAYNTGGTANPANTSRFGNAQYPPGASAAFDLQMLSPLCKSVTHLPRMPTTIIEFEYDTDITHYVTAPGGGAPASIQPTYPVLVYLYKRNPDPIPPKLVIPYYSIESDSGYVVPTAGIAGTTQFTSYQCKAFNGKLVRNLYLANESTAAAAAASIMPLQIRSTAQPEEQIQLTIDGVKYLPFNGANHSALKTWYMNTVVGSMVAPAIASTYEFISQTDDPDNTVMCDPELLQGDVGGQVSYAGFKIDKTISQQIILQNYRTMPTGAGDKQKASYTQRIYGEVARLLTVTPTRAVAIAS